jgi:cytoskeletal protein CcmA (bactofilin family)
MRRPLIALAAALAAVAAGLGWAQQADETVILAAPAAVDQYLAGRDVQVLAEVRGDLVAAGQTVTLSGAVTGDLIAAGETLIVAGPVGDDVRAAGRQVRIGAAVGDHLVAAGQSVALEPGARVGAWAWLAGERIDLHGRVGGEVRAAGARINVTGRIDGDLRALGGRIRILPTAVIGGDLVWSADHPPEIAEGAVIEGEVTEVPLPEKKPAGVLIAVGVGGVIVFLLSLWLTALVLYLLYPGIARRAAGTIGARPWACLGLGLAVVAAGPLAIGLLFATLVGSLLALLLLGAYLLVLVLGGLAGVFAVSEGGLRLLGRAERAGTGARSLALAGALLALLLVQAVPVLGQLAALLTLLLGVGALKLLAYRAWAASR